MLPALSDRCSRRQVTASAVILGRPGDFLETAEQFAAVVGVMLPVAGAVYRETAFAISGRVPLGVGASLPLPDLIVAGLSALLYGLFVGVFLAWLVRTPYRPKPLPEPSVQPTPIPVMVFRKVALVLLVGSLVWLALSAQGSLVWFRS